MNYTRWFKYDRDYFCVNKPVTVPVIFEPPCILDYAEPQDTCAGDKYSYPIICKSRLDFNSVLSVVFLNTDIVVRTPMCMTFQGTVHRDIFS